MMRSRRPWWAVLTAATLVLASLLAPMEGAAYRIVGLEPGGPQKGDPDEPVPSKPTLRAQNTGGPASIVYFLAPIPGVMLRIQVPSRLTPFVRYSNRSQRDRKSVV